MAQQKYIVTSWQGLLQYVSKSLIGKGYYYWHLTELPVHKKTKWREIDSKLIAKYKTNKSKHQRHRRKMNGEANFIYIRWEQYAFIFHTVGSIPNDVTYDDKFYDIRQSPIFLKIGDETTFDISLADNGKAHIKLERETYLGIKALLHNTAQRKNPKILIDAFKMLNGYPAYAGIVKQKKQLREYVVSQAVKHNIKVDSKDGKRNMRKTDFWIYTKCDTVKVFDDNI